MLSPVLYVNVMSCSSRPNVVFTLQAQSEDDLALWLEALDGKTPRYELLSFSFNIYLSVCISTFFLFIYLLIYLSIYILELG